MRIDFAAAPLVTVHRLPDRSVVTTCEETSVLQAEVRRLRWLVGVDGYPAERAEVEIERIMGRLAAVELLALAQESRDA